MVGEHGIKWHETFKYIKKDSAKINTIVVKIRLDHHINLQFNENIQQEEADDRNTHGNTHEVEAIILPQLTKGKEQKSDSYRQRVDGATGIAHIEMRLLKYRGVFLKLQLTN